MRSRRTGLAAAAVFSVFGGVVVGVLPAAYADTPATLYVNPSDAHCDDGGSGLVADAPLCTASAAMSSTRLVPGGTVVISGWRDGVVDVTRSGTPGLPIIVRGGGDGGGITVTGQHDVEIDDATGMPTPSATSGDAIRVVDSQRIVLYHDGGRCCGIGAIHLTGTSDSIVDGSPGGYYSHQEVILDGGSTRNIVENLVTDQQWDASEVTIVDSPGNSVVNNTFARSMDAPVVISGASTGTVVENNIFSGTGDSAEDPASVASVRVEAAATGGTRIGYNIFDPTWYRGPAVWWAGTPYASGSAFDAGAAGTIGHDRDVDPQLPPSLGRFPDDLHPAPTSPAIDGGDGSVAPPRDNEGRTRIDDPAAVNTGNGSPNYTDIGAYEYHAEPFAVRVGAGGGATPSDYRTVHVHVDVSGGWWSTSPTSVSVSVDGGPAKQLNVQGSGEFTVTLSDGEHTLSATAIDAGGTTATSSSTFHVEPTVFTPQLTVTAVPNGDGVVDIALMHVGPLAPFSLDMGDGTPPITGVGQNYDVSAPSWTGTYRYRNSGSYHLTLTATDANGWQGRASADVSVNVPSAPGHPVISIDRIAGRDRYTTAIAASRAQWRGGAADAVVLANGLGFPDALAGVPLAAHVHGPLLLTDPHALDDATAAEIGRALRGAGKTVYVLGGTSAVSDAVLAKLPATVKVRRIGGSDRFETARLIAALIGPSPNVVVANGVTFPDALTAGPLAAKQKAAIVLSDGPVLDKETAAFVAKHDSVTAVGGPAVAAVRSSRVDLSHIRFTWLYGQDRYGTSHQVFNAMTGSGSVSTLGVASGVSFPDALTGGAYMANISQPLVLADPGLANRNPWLSSDLHDEADQVSAANGLLAVFGGPNAVSNRIVDDLALWTHGRVQ